MIRSCICKSAFLFPGISSLPEPIVSPSFYGKGFRYSAHLRYDLSKNFMFLAKFGQQLAEAIGVSRQTINAIESGKYVPSTLLSLKISEIYGKTVNEIFMLEESDR